MRHSAWDATFAGGMTEQEQLVYRSRLIGREPAFVNYGGGNTSAKLEAEDHTGRTVSMLLMKGSGSDLAACDARNFTALRLDEVQLLRRRETMSDEAMTAYLGRCALDPAAPRASIETLLHAYLPFRHIDHTHADAAIAFCCAKDGEAEARRVLGGKIAWVPYTRPGFELARLATQTLPDDLLGYQAIFLEKHGLVTWGETASEAYHNTLDVIGRLEDAFAARQSERSLWRDQVYPALPDEERRRRMVQLLPVLRGALSRQSRMVLHYDASPDVIEFVGSSQGRAMALSGSACPDYVMWTKHLPLWIDDAAVLDDAALRDAVLAGVERYCQEYTDYFESNATPGTLMMDPAPRVVLLPGLGMVTCGSDKWAATNTADLYRRTIRVMQGAAMLGGYRALTPAESYAVEYWPLELYKLTLRPPERELARRVVVITGAAGGIGRATAERLAAESGHIVVCDINADGARATAAAINERYGMGRALAVACDVTQEASVTNAYEEAILAYGGVDIVFSNAGIFASQALEEMSLDEWERTFAILGRGYFLVARAAWRVWKAQGTGGNLIINSSKNGLAAVKNAAGYGAAKAAELHLARSLADEGGACGIRVNAVCPDAVIRNSSIWAGGVLEQRAQAHGVSPAELEEFYRRRTALHVSIYPEDVAEAVLWLASDRSSKTTGCIITVDGGVTSAYPR